MIIKILIMIKLEIIKLLKDSLNYNEFVKKLKNEIPDIYINEYDDEDLALIANKYKINNFNIKILESECKNIIIKKSTLELIVYSNNSIYYNDEANHYLLNNDINTNYDKQIYESYEGTTLFLYYYNNKWYVSTRKCINSDKSLWTSQKTFYKLFCDCLNCNFSSFTSKLDKDKYYGFILLHSDNINIVDYSYLFGDNYNKIVHVMTRDSNTHEEIFDFDINNLVNIKNIIKPNKLENYDLLDEKNKEKKLLLPLNFEGIIIKLTEKETKKTLLLKIHSNSYKIISKLKPNYNCELKMFIDLYKKELLKEHIMYYPNHNNIILSSNNHDIEYDTIGIIDGLFKIITSELFELFKLLYNLKDCSHKNEKLYNELPNEYKIIMYKIRGVYFEKKKNLSANKLDKSKINYRNYNLKIIDIYKLLKEYDSNDLFKLFYSRKNIKILKQISVRCDSVLLDMTNIFINNFK